MLTTLPQIFPDWWYFFLQISPLLRSAPFHPLEPFGGIVFKAGTREMYVTKTILCYYLVTPAKRRNAFSKHSQVSKNVHG